MKKRDFFSCARWIFIVNISSKVISERHFQNLLYLIVAASFWSFVTKPTSASNETTETNNSGNSASIRLSSTEVIETSSISCARRKVSHSICFSRFAVIARQWLLPFASVSPPPHPGLFRNFHPRYPVHYYPSHPFIRIHLNRSVHRDSGSRVQEGLAAESVDQWRRRGLVSSPPHSSLREPIGEACRSCSGVSMALPPPKWLRNRAGIRQPVQNKRAD